jgi:DNA-directed RNA polymerase-3 subunit RPC5
MRRALQDAEEESWVPLEYVDEAEEAAFELFHERMFLHEAEQAPQLNSGMEDDDYLDAISMPRPGSPTRKRKKQPRRREGDAHADHAHGDAEAGAPEALDANPNPTEQVLEQPEGDAMEGVAQT